MKFLAFALGLLFAASYAFSADEETVTGQVKYASSIVLSDEARLEVALVDTSSNEVSAKVISEDILPVTNTGKAEFSLTYQSSDIDPQKTYVVQARIVDGGRLTFVNTSKNMVLTNGFSENVELELKQLSPNTITN